MLWISTGVFLFIMRSSFILLNASRQDVCHTANDLIMWTPNSIPHVKTFPLQSQLLNLILPAHKMKLRLVQNQGIQHNLTVVPFPAVNRKLRFFSCFPLANNTLTGRLLETAACFLRLQINLFLTSVF